MHLFVFEKVRIERDQAEANANDAAVFELNEILVGRIERECPIAFTAPFEAAITSSIARLSKA